MTTQFYAHAIGLINTHARDIMPWLHVLTLFPASLSHPQYLKVPRQAFQSNLQQTHSFGDYSASVKNDNRMHLLQRSTSLVMTRSITAKFCISRHTSQPLQSCTFLAMTWCTVAWFHFSSNEVHHCQLPHVWPWSGPPLPIFLHF